MSTLRGYWRGRRWAFLFLALCFAILALVIALYRLPLTAVGYAGLLCAALALVWLALDFRSYCARHRCLKELQAEIDVTLDHLPPPRNGQEADYQIGRAHV